MARFTSTIQSMFDVKGRSGSEILCRCPWHDDRGKPNLYVNEVTGLYICFRCGAKGCISNLLADGEMPSVDLNDLRARIKSVAKPVVTKAYPQNWLDQFDFPCDYWTDVRGFSPETVSTFRLGYDPIEDRVTIPLRDSKGNVLGVIQRWPDDDPEAHEKPKYKMPKGFKRNRDLFGSWLVRRKRLHRVALVEGPLDAVACWDANVPALALHGSVMSEDQAKLLKTLGVRTVVCMTDNDNGGIDSIVSIKEQLDGMSVLIGQYRSTWITEKGKPCKDPGELTPKRRRHMYLSAVPWHRLLS